METASATEAAATEAAFCKNRRAEVSMALESSRPGRRPTQRSTLRRSLRLGASALTESLLHEA